MLSDRSRASTILMPSGEHFGALGAPLGPGQGHHHQAKYCILDGRHQPVQAQGR